MRFTLDGDKLFLQLENHSLSFYPWHTLYSLTHQPTHSFKHTHTHWYHLKLRLQWNFVDVFQNFFFEYSFAWSPQYHRRKQTWKHAPRGATDVDTIYIKTMCTCIDDDGNGDWRRQRNSRNDRYILLHLKGFCFLSTELTRKSCGNLTATQECRQRMTDQHARDQENLEDFREIWETSCR